MGSIRDVPAHIEVSSDTNALKSSGSGKVSRGIFVVKVVRARLRGGHACSCPLTRVLVSTMASFETYGKLNVLWTAEVKQAT